MKFLNLPLPSSFIIMMLLYSCNSNYVDQLKKENDSLQRKDNIIYSENRGLKDDLKVARDSITMLQNPISQSPKDKVYAFAALSYDEQGFRNGKTGVVVSNVVKYDNLDDERKYRWMDSFAQSFLHQNSAFDYNITNRKVYTFNNYSDASINRDEVYKHGLSE